MKSNNFKIIITKTIDAIRQHLKFQTVTNYTKRKSKVTNTHTHIYYGAIFLFSLASSLFFYFLLNIYIYIMEKVNRCPKGIC